MSTVILIRHAEKPLGDRPPSGVDGQGLTDRESLTPRGWQRAGALVRYFVAGDGRPGSSGLPVPGELVASQVGPRSSSQRPLQTLQPLAQRLGLSVRTAFLKEEIDRLTTALRASDGVVLVSWEHHLIPSIASGLMDRPAVAPRVWPDDRYDVVWVLERVTPTARFTFRQLPQMLLAGDSTDPILDAGPAS